MVLSLTVTAALVFSGFASAGSTPAEKDAAGLLKKRAEVMQRALFGSSSESEIYSMLSAVEVHPLLKNDMADIRASKDSDMDRVVNTKVTGCVMTNKKDDTRVFRVSMRWYLLGYDGYYTEERDYFVHTVMEGERMYLSALRSADV